MAGPEACQRRQGRRFEAPAAVAARSYQRLQIDKRPWDLVFLGVPRLFPKFVSEGAANRSRTSGTGRSRVKDSIILTDFSRCQGHMIGRVSRRSKQPPSLRDKDFP